MARHGSDTATIGIKQKIVRAILHAWPTDVGLWRLMKYLPDTAGLPHEMVTGLRGFPLRIRFHPSSYSGWHLFYRGIYEEKLVRTCHRLLRRDMTFVDIGANVGLYSVVAGNAVGPNGRIIAVEPQPGLAAIVASNAALNLQRNIDVKTLALGEIAAKAILYQPSSTNDGQATLRLRDYENFFGEPVAVEVETLSRLLRRCGISEVGGIKIDVEGAELAVLKGFAEELADRPPEFIFVECIDAHLRRFGATAEELLQFLRKYGYELFCCRRGRWRRIPSSSERAASNISPDLLAIRPATESWRRFASASHLFDASITGTAN